MSLMLSHVSSILQNDRILIKFSSAPIFHRHTAGFRLSPQDGKICQPRPETALSSTFIDTSDLGFFMGLSVVLFFSEFGFSRSYLQGLELL